ncbi:DUF2273 domain-containing protein [Rubrobacter taiwanensis]|jgi:uncharacterized membrane protein|uniref:DUF2273 domain-containing protein n=1 Tax=Rubrobacter taiwanensis TaxID=185139 RepID=A0A4R1BTA4_9ACTN|nr:DUF2273 domain-containing protein [Rubrobacter taiwanensis]TCJ20485.1 DUF2273 domain-containing protein [Rubrobacter taiwanensis]
MNWTMKNYGALIGGIIVFLIVWLGFASAVLVVAGAIIGYFIGRFLDGELDLSDLQDRARGSRRREY